MVDCAKFIAQNLNFNVAGPLDHPLEIAFAITKSGFSFSATFKYFFFNFLLRIYWAHATPTPAPACFQHQRIAYGGGLSFNRCHIIAQHFGRWNDGNSSFNGHASRTGFVAQLAHSFGFGTYKSDARFGAGIHKIRVFRQKSIARVDGVCTTGLGHA